MPTKRRMFMRKTKKTIAGLMAFAMVLSVASCGNNNSDSNSGNSSTVSDNSSQGDNIHLMQVR